MLTETVRSWLLPKFVGPFHRLQSSTATGQTPEFGPSIQTPRQRAWVLQRIQAVIPSLKTEAAAHAQLLMLYQRHVAGKLNWGEVRQALETASA